MFFLKWKSTFDKELKEHLDHSSENAKYTLPQVQNKILSLCEETVCEQIMSSIPKYCNIIADEIQDCSATGQASLCVQFSRVYLNQENRCIIINT